MNARTHEQGGGSGSERSSDQQREVPMSPTREAPSLWRPLRTPLFRQMLVADVVSDVGTFMQGVGAAWLMVSLGAGPLYVALTQTASTLPFFLLALPAGSIGDIVDRRKLTMDNLSGRRTPGCPSRNLSGQLLGGAPPPT